MSARYRCLGFFLMVTLSWGLALGQSAAKAEDALKAKDLAVILPALGSVKVAPTENLFPIGWWQDLAAAFARTSIGDAIERENQRDDWRLVAMRFAPCQPLLPYLSERNQSLCQPELRLVWQPIQDIYRGNRWHYYADDRAIHALYRFEPKSFLAADQARQWHDLSARALTITEVEVAQYAALQRRLVRAISKELRDLRQLSQTDVYDGVGERPEFSTPEHAREFILKLEKFVGDYAKPERLHQLTAFSLPEGRDPPQLDEWVFVAFEPAQAGLRLKPQALTVRSRRDGRLLADYGESAQVSVRRDEAALIDALDRASAADRSELLKAVIWTTRDRRSKAAEIADPRRTHIAHTSCASCHKLGNPPFDFHNLSYFEDRDITVAPRVLKDLEYELEWLSRR